MTARIAGGFVLLVGLVMIAGDLHIRELDPLKSVRLKEYKEKLRAAPTDEKLKVQVRQLDFDLRASYFQHLSKKNSGAYLLLGGAALFVLALTRLEKSRRQPPAPGLKANASFPAHQVTKLSRWCVAASGASVAILLLIVSLNRGTALPRQTADIDKLLGAEMQASTADLASPDEFKKNWPRFRGPDGSGNAIMAAGLPTQWDAKTGAGIAWKTASPAAGYSSPIVWADRLFFSGATARERRVFCLDALTGRMIWQATAQRTDVPGSLPESAGASSYATATVATDGRRVYAFFGNGDLAAYNLDGKLEWSKCFGPLKNAYGHAASLTTCQEKLILQLDQGDAEANKSMLYALDVRNGQILWQRPRRVGSSWATPIVIDVAGKTQIITLAVPSVIAYGANDGAELWRLDGLNGEITPSPTFAAGMVFAISPSEKLVAIRPDGSGDVTKTHVAWSTEENVPDIASPVSDGKLVFALTTPGVLTCFDVADGKKQWEHDFGTEFHSSPSIAAGRIYLFSRKGAALVVEAAREFKELFRTEMGDVFDSSPAFVENRIYLRGETNIWCLGGSSPLRAAKPQRLVPSPGGEGQGEGEPFSAPIASPVHGQVGSGASQLPNPVVSRPQT
jgi:outer membrane protein assembly factor BamB